MDCGFKNLKMVEFFRLAGGETPVLSPSGSKNWAPVGGRNLSSNNLLHHVVQSLVPIAMREVGNQKSFVVTI